MQILAILNERVASPNELSQQLDEGLSQVSYHVKVLVDCDCIELVRTKPRRGAVEHEAISTKSLLNCLPVRTCGPQRPPSVVRWIPA